MREDAYTVRYSSSAPKARELTDAANKATARADIRGTQMNHERARDAHAAASDAQAQAADDARASGHSSAAHEIAAKKHAELAASHAAAIRA